MTLEGDVESTIVHAVQRSVAAGADATTNVPEKSMVVNSAPANLDEDTDLNCLVLALVVDVAIGASTTDYHSVVLTKYDRDGANAVVVSTTDLKGATPKFGTINLATAADAAMPLAQGERITLKTTHTGTPAAAFPGGTLVVTLAPISKNEAL